MAKWQKPFPDKTITGEYGTMSAYRKKHGLQPHSGTDWAPAGSNKGNTKIPSIADGEIKLIQWSNVLGWVIVQDAKDNDGKTWYIGYCHIKCGTHGITCKGPKVHGDHAPIKKKVGDKVEVGQVMAYIGNTGSASSGAHLHATAGKTVKAVFGTTAQKSDLKKLIEANQTAAAPKTAKKTAKPAAAAKQVVYACPHCKKELH